MKIEEIFMLLNAITEVTDKMDSVSFGSLYCTLAESWCKAHGESIYEFINTIHEMVFQVNDELGEF